MIKNSNKLFKNFNFEKSKFLIQKWKSKEDFFDYYENIEDPEHKSIVFNQIKNLFVINYGKKFMKKNQAIHSKKIWNIKQFYFRSSLFMPIILLIALIWSLALFFAIPNFYFNFIYFKIVILIVPSFIYFIILLIIIFSYRSKLSKLPIKEIKLVFNGFNNLKNHFFEFKNKSEIIRFMKLKEVPKKIWFSWNDEDFKLFSVLYSREIYNRINNCLSWSAINFRHWWPKKIQLITKKEKVFYSLYTRPNRMKGGFLIPVLNLKKFNDKEIMPEKTESEISLGWDFPIIKNKRWQLSQEKQFPICKEPKKSFKNFFKCLKYEIIFYLTSIWFCPLFFTIFGTLFYFFGS